MIQQPENVEDQMELARRIEAMMRSRTPEQAALFLARLLVKLDAISLSYLEMAFNFAEDLVSKIEEE